MKKIKLCDYEIEVDAEGNHSYGGYLYLGGTAITALPDNLTVGGSLDLGGTAITALPDNLTVGGYLDLRGTAIEDIDTSSYSYRNIPMFSWQGGKYILADGVFTEVINKRGNVYKVKRIGKPEILYLVTDGHGRFAHGDTIKSAKQDLIYKLSEDASKEEFANLKMTDVLSFEKCIQLYRVVTGSCAFGVRNFIESHGIENRSYTLAEVIEKTKGQYGSDSLKAFFAGRMG
jgi:hypothetical protein